MNIFIIFEIYMSLDLRHCWVTSFGWCMKEQTVDLIKEYCDESVLDNIKPNIVVSEW